MKNKRLKAFLIFGILLVGYLVYLFTQDDNGSLEARASGVTVAAFNSPRVANETNTVALPPDNLGDMCPSFQTAQDAFQRLVRRSVVSSHQVLTENLHYYTDTGEERRIHILPNNNLPEGFELRLFKLDSEGYPEIIENKVPKNALLQGRVPFFAQKIIGYFFEDNSYLEVDEVNQKIMKLSYRGNGINLNCSQGQCGCRPSLKQ